ncbi:MAG: ABC transporter ATP-binding protein [Candidatus Eisenbacteria bacterium]
MSEHHAVQMRGITKRYPRVLANDGVDLDVKDGEIHAIVGENGAGKSTIMKVLYGLTPPDAGQILLWGKELTGHRPSDAIREGVGMVHQHFMLVDTLTVAENVVLGTEPVRCGCLIDTAAARERVRQLSSEYGLSLDPDELIENLSVGLEQRVEIVKVLYRGAKILILDEPTGVLTPAEVRELFAILRALRDAGRTIVFITHKLEEVLELADRITVMRDGRVAGVVPAAGTTKEELARMMVGRDVLLRVTREEASPGGPVLQVRGLSAAGRKGSLVLDGINLEVRSGEVLGIAGVQGNGQTELVEVIAGLKKASAGSVAVCGNETTNRSPRQVRNLGVAHIPEDRQARGLVLGFTIAENLVLGRHHRRPFSSRGLLSLDAIRVHAERLIEEHDLRPADPDADAGHLSGGNQQKLIVAREFDGGPALLIASQPTRGVDIGAIEFVHTSLLRMRDRGAAILLISAELTEIMTLSDRIAVMFGGRIVAEFEGGAVGEEELGVAMTGGAGQAAGGADRATGDATDGRAGARVQ